MKGAIFYYSATGNTELASKFIVSKLEHVDFMLFNITKCEKVDLMNYDIIGFSFPTFHMGIPQAFKDFLGSIQLQKAKPTFLLNTFGMMQGKALKIANDILDKKGFCVIASHALMMPENYPRFIVKGWCSEDRPDEKQISAFKGFITEISRKLDDISKGKLIEKVKIRIGLLNNLIGVKSKGKILKEMGEFNVDVSLCTKCGTCEQNCPYSAIEMKGLPVFERSKCWGCWTCFNKCPQKAIHTDAISAASQYNGPDRQLMERLK